MTTMLETLESVSKIASPTAPLIRIIGTNYALYTFTTKHHLTKLLSCLAVVTQVYRTIIVLVCSQKDKIFISVEANNNYVECFM